MPRPDPPHGRRARLGGVYLSVYRDRPGKRPRRKGGEPEREPVEPANPKPLAGGAAAPLEFDD